MSATIIDLETVDSTNLEARRRIADGAADGTIVTAREQTGGRARRGRSWTSPPGNLYWTQIRYPTGDWPPAWGLSMVSALAVRDLARAALPAAAPIALKWPNDVLVQGKKLAGILLESGEQAGRHWVICGIGVNLVSSPPTGQLYQATDLQSSGATAIDRDAAVGDLAGYFSHHLAAYLAGGLPVIRDRVLTHLAGVGGPITARVSDDPGDDVTGTLRGLDAQCRAEIETADGTVRALSAGDLFFGPPPQPAAQQPG
ncbi:MAG: biotin--[acetyl-CoA-carboxylase] ligase [Thalassobaculaceae bacterium]|nr:biotin--[acetyl-CoA-carboxylase] ligase [Thalassobaculaceae bacterium]